MSVPSRASSFAAPSARALGIASTFLSIWSIALLAVAPPALASDFASCPCEIGSTYEDGDPGAVIDIGGGGFGNGMSALPPNFFGPGSDPFNGEVPVKSSLPTFHGHKILVPRPPFGGGPGPIAIETELVGLELVSVAPIQVSFGGTLVPYDVFITLEPGPQVGQFELLHDTSGLFDGGEFGANSYYDLDYRVTFQEQGTGTPGPSVVVTERLYIDLVAPVPWSHAAPPGVVCTAAPVTSSPAWTPPAPARRPSCSRSPARASGSPQCSPRSCRLHPRCPRSAPGRWAC